MAAAWPAPVQAASLYLCKDYSGNQFWSNGHCNRNRAHIERIVSVPDGMPFEDQVSVARRSVAELTRPLPVASPGGIIGIQSGPVPGSERECDALLDRIRTLDSMRHEIRPPLSLDEIAQRKQWAEARRASLRCR
ncbi:hypothetical protein [Ideonella margarita]|uniref:DUF4124 domain-containing protein n=1 Tax=Ideonella margarita TaxID=2984191 RepID=A0ABU9CB00_9BURK